jgi:hypothetical protein
MKRFYRENEKTFYVDNSPEVYMMMCKKEWQGKEKSDLEDDATALARKKRG